MHVSVHRWIPSTEKIKEPAAGRPSRHSVAPGPQHAKGNNSEKRRPLRGSHCGTFGGQILVLRKQLRLKNARCRRSVAERAAKTPAAEPDGFSKSHTDRSGWREPVAACLRRRRGARRCACRTTKLPQKAHVLEALSLLSFASRDGPATPSPRPRSRGTAGSDFFVLL